MKTTAQSLARYYEILHDIALLRDVSSLLDWDQQVTMPPAGGTWRAEQLELMSRLAHQRMVSPEFVDLVHQLSGASDISDDDRVNVEWTLYEIKRTTVLPEEFVGRLTVARAASYEAWIKAREGSDFSLVASALREVVELTKQYASLQGASSADYYSALLEDYEPGLTTAEVVTLFDALVPAIKRLVPEPSEHKPLPRVDATTQEAFCRKIVQLMGYDFSRGRLDRAPHPFCSGLGPGDVRITARYDESNFLSAALVVLHEGGHALYDQGLPEAKWGTPLGSAVSLGIHESQSRFWENYVGRSPEFSRIGAKMLHDEGVAVSPGDILKVLTHVTPSLIRVDADQLTYPLHVWIRTKLEIELMAGEVEVGELPARWNALYKEHLGLEPKSDKDGILQDVHWYHGAIGYFPTYVLGELIAATIDRTLRLGSADYPAAIEKGEWGAIRTFLEAKVFRHGRRFRMKELVEQLSGAPLSAEPYLERMRELVAASSDE